MMVLRMEDFRMGDFRWRFFCMLPERSLDFVRLRRITLGTTPHQLEVSWHSIRAGQARRDEGDDN